MLQELFSNINYLAVLVSAVAAMAVGFVWFGPLFEKQWSALTGWTREKIAKLPQSQMTQSYVGTFVASLVMMFILANVLKLAQATTVVDGLLTAFLMWLGFSATTSAGNYLFEHRPLRLWLIDQGNYLATLLVGGVILTLWK